MGALYYILIYPYSTEPLPNNFDRKTVVAKFNRGLLKFGFGDIIGGISAAVDTVVDTVGDVVETVGDVVNTVVEFIGDTCDAGMTELHFRDIHQGNIIETQLKFQSYQDPNIRVALRLSDSFPHQTS